MLPMSLTLMGDNSRVPAGFPVEDAPPEIASLCRTLRLLRMHAESCYKRTMGKMDDKNLWSEYRAASRESSECHGRLLAAFRGFRDKKLRVDGKIFSFHQADTRAGCRQWIGWEDEKP